MPITSILAALVSAALGGNAAAVPVERPGVRVLVHTEGSFALDRRMLTEITTTARDVWRPYVDVTFDLLGGTLRSPGSVELVITDRTSALSGGASLGWIEFVDGRPSNVITVSATAAVALMNASRWNGLPKTVQRTFLIRALARAIAHELGHYLLGSREHARQGLMRGQLTADDIMQPRRTSDRLDRAQVQNLRSRVELARRDEPAGTDSIAIPIAAGLETGPTRTP